MLWSWIVCKRGEHACAVAGRLSTVTLRASYFGSSWASSQAPPRLVTTVKLRRERSAAWLSGVLPLPIHDPGHVPIMARGRLVAQCHDTTEFERNRSVARPQPCPWAQASWMCYEIGPCLWRLPWQASCRHPAQAGLQRLFISSLSKTHTSSSTFLVRGWLRHSPQIFTVPLHIHHPGAAYSLYNCRKCLDLERLLFPFRPTTHHVHSSPLATVS
jgi:hypothetical protein